jgi:hypothetical protein
MLRDLCPMGSSWYGMMLTHASVRAVSKLQVTFPYTFVIIDDATVYSQCRKPWPVRLITLSICYYAVEHTLNKYVAQYTVNTQSDTR